MGRGMLAWMLSALLAGISYAADTAETGTVRGRVVNQKGAPIAAKLVISNAAGKFRLNQSATGDGIFMVILPAPWSYEIEIMADGYQSVIMQNVEIVPGETRDLRAIQLSVGGCESRMICDDLGLLVDLESSGPLLHSSGNIDMERNCTIDFDEGKMACGNNSNDALSDLALRMNEEGNVYLAPQNGSTIAIDSRPDWKEAGCRAVQLSSDTIRIDQFDLNTRVCVKTNAGRYVQVFGFFEVGSTRVRMTFLTWPADTERKQVSPLFGPR